MTSNASVKRKLTENIHRVQDQLQAACARARRDPNGVELVIVTKYADVDLIRALLDLGHTELGESRVQQLTQRAGMIAEYRSRLQSAAPHKELQAPNWHMIGHLQRNKIKSLLPHVKMIHSVDSLRLAEELSNQAAAKGRTVDYLLEVNAAEEDSKYGLAVAAVTHVAEQVQDMPGLRLRGLMSMAPPSDDKEQVRWAFARTRELFEEIRAERSAGPDFRHLSMGMSLDYPIAVEEGATIVRIGSAIFEGLIAPAPQ